MAQTPYYYGTFNINDGINYFLVEKTGLGMQTVQQSYAKVGRIEGMKKTGETTNERILTVKILVLGTSRSDLENKLDTLLSSMNLRQQTLKLHANDARYFIADCIDVTIPYSQLTKTDPNGLTYVTVQATFLALQPYALASTASSFTTNQQTLTLVSGTSYQYSFSNSGGGNVFARPHITITKKDALTWTALSITQSTDGETLTVNNTLPTANGDTIDIYCDPSAANGYTVVKNSTTQCGFSGLFPVIENGTTNWTLNVTLSAAGSPSAIIAFAWTARWLS